MSTNLAPAIEPITRPTHPTAPKRQLTLLDSTCIIVGIIIGSGIFQTSPMIASCTASPLWLIGLWTLGGALSLIGALCYAELATAYPHNGGDYVYLTRAFGRPTGFLFAWAQLWIVRPGSVGLLAYVFARYANQLYSLGDGTRPLMIYATAAVLILTGINLLGVRGGKWTQNVLTAIKVLGLAAIVVVGLLFSSPPPPPPPAAPGAPDYRLAMILILFTYGGWNEMAYVSAEVRDPRRNILRSLVLGTLAVTLIYVVMNLAFIHALGYRGTADSQAVAADVLRLGLGDWGGRIISLLICISALGAINGMIFTGARITYAMGSEHRFYSWLGRWNPRLDAPLWSLVLQALITVALVVGFGRKSGGFQSLVNFTTPVFWIFFLLVGISLFVLRFREPATPRPYCVPGYPLVPGLFCLSSLFMLYASITWAWENRSPEAFWSIAILVVGCILLIVERARQRG
jgi:amino acid transporter